MLCQQIEDDYGTLAVFDAEAKAKLPAEGLTDVPLEAVILDVKTGITYEAKQNYIAFDEQDWPNVYAPGAAWSLNHYFYSEHWCGCHRWSDIESSNPEAEIDDENDCPGERFYVLSLTHPNLPGVVLYSEVPPTPPQP